LDYAIDKSRNTLNEAIGAYNQEVSWQFWKTVVVSALASMIASIVIMTITLKVLPAPMLPISNQQLEHLHLGQSLAAIWSKLTKVERERLRKLADDTDRSAGM
jgi:hypothetical protein